MEPWHLFLDPQPSSAGVDLGRGRICSNAELLLPDQAAEFLFLSVESRRSFSAGAGGGGGTGRCLNKSQPSLASPSPSVKWGHNHHPVCLPGLFLRSRGEGGSRREEGEGSGGGVGVEGRRAGSRGRRPAGAWFTPGSLAQHPSIPASLPWAFSQGQYHEAWRSAALPRPAHSPASSIPRSPLSATDPRRSSTAARLSHTQSPPARHPARGLWEPRRV